jgi:coenzyme F420 hydrogenase subunit beta
MLPAGSHTISSVLKNDLCAGCGLCASLSGGGMRSAGPGFARPTEAAPIDRGLEAVLEASCPGSNVASWHAAPQMHPFWGPAHNIFTGHASDEELRFRASSGGVITALLIHALRAGYVDRVIQIAADPENPISNITACSRTVEEVAASAGSRYAPSSPLENIDGILAEGGRIAFVGKPCDVSALRQLARFDERAVESIQLILSFFCAGIPSTAGTREILRQLEVDEVELREFRYRGHGWPGKATAITKNRTAEMSYDRSWGGILSKQVQFRCKICPDAVGGVADVACADAWYGDEDGYPVLEEADGRSLVISRTERGNAFLASAMDEGVVRLRPAAAEDIDLMQPSQARRKRLVKSRTAALKTFLVKAPGMAGLMIDDAAKRGSIWERVRSYLGTARRVLLG